MCQFFERYTGYTNKKRGQRLQIAHFIFSLQNYFNIHNGYTSQMKKDPQKISKRF